mgnify:CR=1 FL=1
MDGHSEKLNRKSDHIQTSQDPADFKDWPQALVEEMRKSQDNGCVGSVLVSETNKVRVWHLRLPPGYRCPFHRHVNPYFWSSHNDGLARNYFSSGEIKEVNHFAGETRHFYYDEDEYMLHSVENIGDSELLFTTVEFIDGKNRPLDIPDSHRLKEPTG